MKTTGTIALTASTVLGLALSFGVAAGVPTATAARKPPATPSPTPTPTSTPSAGPVAAALAGYTVPVDGDITGTSAAFVVPTPTCTTAVGQAVSIGLGAQVAAGAPHSVAVVIVGCDAQGAPYALSRAVVGSFVTSGPIAFGAHVAVEITASGGNAAATVRNVDTGTSIVALAGANDTSTTFGAFGVLGDGSLPLPTPDFGTVKLTHNVVNGQQLAGGTMVSSAKSGIGTGPQDASGDFALTYLP